MRTADFLISDIQPCEGHSLRYLHMDVAGAPCYVEDIQEGTRALIMYKPEYDSRFHRLHTSVVNKIEREEDDKIVKVTTMNTIYTLTRTNCDNETYVGLQCMTEEDAETFITKYISTGLGARLMETIYNGRMIDKERAVESLMHAVKWLGESREDAIYHVFWDALCEQE